MTRAIPDAIHAPDGSACADRSRRSFPIRTAAGVGLAAFLLPVLAGCGEQEPIRSYEVPKQHVLRERHGLDEKPQSEPQPQRRSSSAQADPQRMLAAMVPHGEQAWFFKLVGPPEAVAAEKQAFLGFLKSVRFSGRTPAWDLPDGWRQDDGGSRMRFATLRISSGDQPLEVSVIPLGRPDENRQQWLLSNVNRWRNQLQLPPIARDQLPEEIERIELEDGTTATFSEFVGRGGGGGMNAPFAGGDHPPVRSGGSSAERGESGASSQLSYDTPQGWSPGRVGGMRKAAFVVQDGGKSVEITVIPLAAQAGKLLPNVNRWRGQIGLEPIEQNELDEQVRPITVGGTEGHYLELVNPESGEAIFAAVAVPDNRAWFITMKGHAELARREQPRFEAFVQSIEFNTD